MRSRKNQRLLDVLVGAAAWLPWWSLLPVAAISYLLLHTVSALAARDARTVWHTVALFAQYILPAALAASALASAMRARRAAQLYESIAAGASRASLLDMGWPEFAALVGGYFRSRGYEVMDAAESGGDAGMDIEIGKDGERYLVQCKRWRADRVGVDGVQDLLGSLPGRAAAGGFVVTSGSFTPGAFRFAEGLNVELVDGQALLAAMLVQAAASAPRSAGAGCPKCRAPMLRRTAQQGPRSGEQFWACSAFPGCRGVRPIQGRSE